MNRVSGTELLRSIAAIGVMTLHYSTAVHEIVLSRGMADIALLCLLKSMFLPAVNVFILISSYYLSAHNNRDLRKPLAFYVKVVVYSFGLYCVTAIPAGTFSFGSALWRLIPGNWYLPLYIALYLISPFINVAIQNITQASRRRMVIIFLLLFSVIPTVVDLLKAVTGSAFGGWEFITTSGSGRGYTFVQFVLMYVLGAYLRHHPPHVKRSRLLQMLLLNLACIITWVALGERYGGGAGSVISSYCNPFIVSCAVLYFLIFQTLRFQNSFINLLGRVSVSLFLVHGWTTEMTAPWILSVGLLLPWIVSVIVEYAVSIPVELLYERITRPLFRKERMLRVE
ncbi:MAG: acyltransferase family protein [Lachnospiraceae bacterium]|nr:acyltransferase family protein [Lachnospiraceae bacterium]